MTGELHGFVGPNGAGEKPPPCAFWLRFSNLPKGRLRWTAWTWREHPREIRRLMGYMPDFFGVYDRLKAWEYLDFYARCYGFGKKDAGA